MMKRLKFAMCYNPAKHEGVDNVRNKTFMYYVDFDGEVLTNKGHKVGFVAHDRDSNSVKAFRWDRVQPLIALDA